MDWEEHRSKWGDNDDKNIYVHWGGLALKTERTW